MLADGVAHRVALQAARKVGADLIVMSTHGRSGLSHLVMGSVAEKVVRGAACPVVTVRARKSAGGRARRSSANRPRR
jgi:nucleotide-binding universal stress UspA family protein